MKKRLTCAILAASMTLSCFSGFAAADAAGVTNTAVPAAIHMPAGTAVPADVSMPGSTADGGNTQKPSGTGTPGTENTTKPTGTNAPSTAKPDDESKPGDNGKSDGIAKPGESMNADDAAKPAGTIGSSGRKKAASATKATEKRDLLITTEQPTETAEPTQAPTPAPTVKPNTDANAFDPNSKDPFTKTKYNHGTVADGKNIYLGIDVSHHQKKINWEKVKDSGVQFAIIRCGYRGSSAGTLNTDNYFKQNIEGAYAAGIPIGIYFYSIAITEAEAKAEANYCINLLKNYKHMVSLPVAIDYEDRTKRMTDADLSKTKAAKICEKFCETVKAEGYTPMVYSYLSYFKNYLDGEYLSKKYKIWYAQYSTRVGLANDNYKTYIDGDYEYWQYSSKGKVNGIEGNVDCNFWYAPGNMNALINGTKITKAKLSAIPNKTYTGKAIKPGVTLTYKNKKLKKNTDYTVSYSNNKKIGKATITIKGKGEFYGTRTKTFKIIPKKVASFKKKSGTKMITLSWKKNANATGYIIYRKSSYNAKKYKKVKAIKTNATKKWLNTKLKADREYFYSIRAYTTVGKTKYYSEYTYLTAPTLPGSKKAVLKKSLKMYSTPALAGTSLVKIPKKAAVTYLGRTYTSGANFVYHVKYAAKGKTYSGYIKNTAKFTY